MSQGLPKIPDAAGYCLLDEFSSSLIPYTPCFLGERSVSAKPLSSILEFGLLKTGNLRRSPSCPLTQPHGLRWCESFSPFPKGSNRQMNADGETQRISDFRISDS